MSVLFGQAGCACCAPPWRLLVRGCTGWKVVGAAVSIYSSPGGVLLFSGTTDAWGGVTWPAPGPGTYRVVVTADSFQDYDQVRTISGTSFVDLAVDSAHTCCVGNVCRDPVPKTLYLTDDVGTAAMTYSGGSVSPRWHLIRFVNLDYVSDYLRAYGDCYLGPGVASFRWTLRCPSLNAHWFETCCLNSYGEKAAGKWFSSSDWKLSLDFSFQFLGETTAPFYDYGCHTFNTSHPSCVFARVMEHMDDAAFIGAEFGIIYPTNLICYMRGALPDDGDRCGPDLALEFAFPSELVPITHDPECEVCRGLLVAPPPDEIGPFTECHLTNPVGTSVIISA